MFIKNGGVEYVYLLNTFRVIFLVYKLQVSAKFRIRRLLKHF